LNTPHVARGSTFATKEDAVDGGVTRIPVDDFDLRDEVMSCIAKSIGLLQPPLSGADSVEASPAFPATESGRGGSFSSSFGSLSLLDLRDDSSSLTGGSLSLTNGGYMSGLDNEVEILFFAAGSTLAKAGERNTGNNLIHASRIGR
jgi:lysophospholipid hydrolase